MGKYKKRLRAEKAKVKLKKKLTKGQNITDTAFKVKKIITVEQLKKVDEHMPLSSWNVPFKDLLIHLGHHNKTTRLNALNGIKEVIMKYPDLLKGPSLRTIVVKVLELLSDLEHKIRTAAVSLLDIVFTNLNSCEIKPFYDILNIHLACTMTHRHVAIQKDSLKLTDTIMKHAPYAIRQNFKIIAANFVRILSGYKYGTQSETFLIKSSKGDLEENRIGIFQRLYKILNICCPNAQEERKIPEKYVSYSDSFSKRIWSSHFQKVPDLSDIFKLKVGSGHENTNDSHVEDYMLIVSHIVPLLFETWTEFSPKCSNNEFIDECIIKETTARLLAVILEIMILVCEASSKVGNKDMEKMLKKSYGQQFVKLFCSGFPYLPGVLEEDRNFPSLTVNENESIFAYSKNYNLQNLNICYLVLWLNPSITNNLRKILDNYVLCALSERNTKNEEILSKIVEVAILSPGGNQLKGDTFLETAVKAYKNTMNPGLQKRLLETLFRAASEKKGNFRFECLKDWATYLAKTLCTQKVDIQVLEILGRLIRRKVGEGAVKEIERNFNTILTNLARVEVHGCEQFKGKKSIANILYWCDNSIIANALKSDVFEQEGYPDDIRTYIRRIFRFKLNILPACDYLSKGLLSPPSVVQEINGSTN